MKSIYQVEISNLCNRRCLYCAHPLQKRKKGLMDFKTFQKVVELHVKLKQKYIVLHNFGEPLLHPDLLDFVQYAHENGLDSCFSTNGVLFADALAKKLKACGLVSINWSAHVPSLEKDIMKICKKHSIKMRKINNFFHDWGGKAKKKIKYKRTGKNFPCSFIQKKWGVVLWDGRINVCCIDCEGEGVFGSVFDKDILAKSGSRIPLCKTCPVTLVHLSFS